MYLMNRLQKVFDISNNNNIDVDILNNIKKDGIDYLIKSFYRIDDNDKDYKYHIDYLITYINSYLKNDVRHVTLNSHIYYKKKELFNLLMFFVKNGIKCNIIDEIYERCIITCNFEYILDVLIYEPKFSVFLVNKEIYEDKLTSDDFLNKTFLGLFINTEKNDIIQYIQIFITFQELYDYVILWLNKFYKLNRFNKHDVNKSFSQLLIRSYFNVYNFSSYMFIEIHNESMNDDFTFDLAHIFNKKYNFDYNTRDTSIVSCDSLKLVDYVSECDKYSPIILMHNKICDVTILFLLYKLIKIDDVINEYKRNYENMNEIQLYIDSMTETLDLYLLYFINDNKCYLRNLINYYRILGKYINIISKKDYSLYRYVPDNIIRNINSTILFISDINDRFTNIIDVKTLINIEMIDLEELIYKIMSKRLYCSNPYIRMDAIESVRFFVSMDINHYFIDYIDNIIQMYIDLEYFDTNNQYFEKFKYRSYIINILEKFVSYNSNTKNHNKQIAIIDFTTTYLSNVKNNEKLTKLLYMYLSDFNYLWEEIIDKFKGNIAYYDFYFYASRQFSKLDSYLSLLVKLFNFKNISGLLISEGLKEKFIQSLNYNIKLLIDLPNDTLNTLNYKYGIYTIVKKIITTYHIFLNKDIDISILISQDERCYSDHFINDIIKLYRKLISPYSPVNLTYIYSFKIFENVIKRIKLNYDKKIENLELPNEYIDPLTCCEIKEPLLLPSSNIIIDKKTIFTHLLSHNNDPFNRQHLTNDILKEYNERDDIKDKINKFLNDKKTWISNNIKD